MGQGKGEQEVGKLGLWLLTQSLQDNTSTLALRHME